MDTKNGQAALQTQPEAFTDAELAALVARLQQDPIAARHFAFIQREGHDALRELSQELLATLAAMEPARPAVDADTDWRRYAGQAKLREHHAKDRRELAQQLILGMLVNLDNPDWNPLDPATSKNPADSKAFALFDPYLATRNGSGK
jgi:ABC-type thiamine transport system substrate-binding protein